MVARDQLLSKRFRCSEVHPALIELLKDAVKRQKADCYLIVNLPRALLRRAKVRLRKTLIRQWRAEKEGPADHGDPWDDDPEKVVG